MTRSCSARCRFSSNGIGSGLAAGLLVALGLALGPAIPARAEPAGPAEELSDPPARAGRIALVNGTVSYRASGQEKWSGAELNHPVTSGDGIWTEPASHAVIEIGPAALRLDEGTELEADRIDLHVAALSLPQGSANVRLAQLDEGDSYEIATPRGTVSLLAAGLYRIDAGNGDEPSRVVVFRGAARFAGKGSAFAVEPGQAVDISGTGSLAYAVHPADRRPLDRWAASLDEGPAVSPVASATTRYVSPQATGYQDLDRYGSWQTTPDQGAVWYPTAVAVGWAPYRYGHWAWVAPWGWTWIDDAPWGFTPFHYGRWVLIRERWAWVPGLFVVRPVYAPALVVFIETGSYGITAIDVGGPAVAWIPLAPREVFIPQFQCSPRFIEQVNITTVNKVVIEQVIHQVVVVERRGQIAQIGAAVGPAFAARADGFANRRALTAVAHRDFVGAHPVARAVLPVAPALVKAASALPATAGAAASPKPAPAASADPAPQPPPAPPVRHATSKEPVTQGRAAMLAAAHGPAAASMTPVAVLRGRAPSPHPIATAPSRAAPPTVGASPSERMPVSGRVPNPPAAGKSVTVMTGTPHPAPQSPAAARGPSIRSLSPGAVPARFHPAPEPHAAPERHMPASLHATPPGRGTAAAPAAAGPAPAQGQRAAPVDAGRGGAARQPDQNF